MECALQTQSQMFVAATVLLLLPPVTSRRITDAKGLRWPRHSQIAAVPYLDATIRGGGWQSGDRSAGSRLEESGFHSSIAIRDAWETGTAPPPRSQSVGRKVPCDGCEAPASGFRKPRHSPVFLPVCRHGGMGGLRPWAALTGEVRYRIDAFVGHCPGRRVSQTVSSH